MRRFTDLFKSLASPTDDKAKTPSFIKPNNPAPPPPPATTAGATRVPAAPAKVAVPHEVKPSDTTSQIQKAGDQTKNLSSDKIDVPVYKNDSEWDVVQRSINLFADNAHLGSEAKQAFVKKWVTELAKAEQTTLYRNEDGEGGHLGNEINRSVADSTTGLLGTYQAMIDPGRQARMTDELKALRYIEEFDLGIISVHLSREVKMDLINTVIGTIEEQKNAAQKLTQKAAKAQPEADRVYASIKALASCREMRLNAAIKTAILKMDAAKYQQLGLQSSDGVTSTSSPRQTSVTERTTSPKAAIKEPPKPKVSESDWVDEQALKLFGNVRR